ncbi:MAG TPA: cytochrome c maturation protein CcmE [Acidimicrobiales bacterium]|nr:cytochrome c maturation protein CcmE [Acidimicrobiales bacterium]
MELTPRTLEPGDDAGAAAGAGAPGDGTPRRRPRRGRRRWPSLAVLVVVVGGLGLFGYKGLNDATLYFRNADEAVAQRDSLGTKRFRLQGTVTGEPSEAAGVVDFTVAFNGVTVAVRHQGSPPDLFRPGVPVVLEGRWSDAGDVFESDRILVKHDESYEAKDEYETRTSEAERGGGTPGSGEPAG